MNREQLLSSREYWITKIQLGLFNAIDNYLNENKISRTELAGKLGVSKGYISQVLNGDFDHKISKLVDLSLAAGKVPVITFEDLEQHIQDDELGLCHVLHHNRPIITLDLNSLLKSNEDKQDETPKEEYAVW